MTAGSLKRVRWAAGFALPALLGALLALTACATPMRQSALAPAADFAGPHLAEDAFVSFDGARLGAQSWLPEGEPVGVIAGVHGMGDYSETFYLAGPWWAAQGYAVHAFDQRGFGRSPQRGVWPAQEVMQSDITAFVAALRAEYPGRPVALVGVSMGAAASLAAVGSDDPPDVDALVLVSPAVWGWSQMNPLYRVALGLANAVAPGWTLTGASLDRWPSDNIEMLRKIGADPLMVRGTRVDAIAGLTDLMQSGWETHPATRAPTLILMGEKDEIVPTEVIERYAERQAPDAAFIRYPEGWHMLLRDLQAERVWRDILEFVEAGQPVLAAGSPVAE